MPRKADTTATRGGQAQAHEQGPPEHVAQAQAHGRGPPEHAAPQAHAHPDPQATAHGPPDSIPAHAAPQAQAHAQAHAPAHDPPADAAAVGHARGRERAEEVHAAQETRSEPRLEGAHAPPRAWAAREEERERTLVAPAPVATSDPGPAPAPVEAAPAPPERHEAGASPARPPSPDPEPLPPVGAAFAAAVVLTPEVAPASARVGGVLVRVAAALLAKLGWRRATDADALREGTRAKLIAALRERPGATMRGLARTLGLTPQNVSYHLRLMQRAGIVGRAASQGGFYLAEAGAPARAVAGASRRVGGASRRAVLAAVVREPGLHVAELARSLGLRHGSASWAVHRLATEGLVEPRREGMHVRCYPTDGAASALQLAQA